jgi:hypothetical protein
MGKHLIWIIAFLVLAFAGDRLVGYFLKKITTNSQFRYSKLYNDTTDAVILFVGNSRGLNFYQPEAERLTNQATANLSYNGMPADLAKNLVMDYFDRHINPPKLMIVDITLCDRENDMLKSGFNLYTPYSYRLDTLLRGISTGGDTWAGRKILYGGKVSHLYRHNSEIFQRVLYYRQKTDKDWLIDRVINSTAATDTALASYKIRMFPDMVEHLRQMIDFAKSKGTEVKLVINPYFPAFAESPPIRDSFLMPLKTHVEAVTGMTVYDFSTALQNIDEIGDYQHANKKGSIRYMNILAENGLLNTHSISQTNADAPPQYQTMETSLVYRTIQDSIDSAMTALSEKMALISESPQVIKNPFPDDLGLKQKNTNTAPPKVKRKKRVPPDDYGFAVDTLFSKQ